MKPFALGVAVFMVLSAGHAQSSPSAHTSGTCSPALNGNGNQITISCTGLSAQKASELIRIMNQILARQLDLKQVNLQLEQIHSQVEALGKVHNPYEGASQEQLALLKESSDVVSACQDFQTVWSQQMLNGEGAGEKDRISRIQAARYRKLLEPRLVAWRSNVLKQMHDESYFGVDYDSTDDATTITFVCVDVVRLAGQYQRKLFADLHPATSR